jgi:hypothetical protein
MSYTCTIRRSRIRRSSFASVVKRSRIAGSAAQLSASTLMATSTSNSVSRASQTVANAPAPSRLMTG